MAKDTSITGGVATNTDHAHHHTLEAESFFYSLSIDYKLLDLIDGYYVTMLP